MRIIYFTDPHYSSINLSSRKDFYPDTMLEKTKMVLDLATEREVDMVICGGDFGHVKRMSQPYLNKLIRLYNSYKLEYGIDIGNHDMYYADVRTADSCPVGAFLASGIFKPDMPNFIVEKEDAVILFLPYLLDPQPFEVPKYLEKKMILVAHQFLPGTYGVELLPADLTNQFDYILMGHDHDVYPIEKVNRATVIRPGALSRGTRVLSNWNRGVFVAYIDTAKDVAEYVELPVKPATEIFSKERLVSEKRIKADGQGVMEELARSVGLVETESLSVLLEGMNLLPNVKDRVLHWLREYAII